MDFIRSSNGDNKTLVFIVWGTTSFLHEHHHHLSPVCSCHGMISSKYSVLMDWWAAVCVFLWAVIPGDLKSWSTKKCSTTRAKVNTINAGTYCVSVQNAFGWCVYSKSLFRARTRFQDHPASHSAVICPARFVQLFRLTPWPRVRRYLPSKLVQYVRVQSMVYLLKTSTVWRWVMCQRNFAIVWHREISLCVRITAREQSDHSVLLADSTRLAQCSTPCWVKAILMMYWSVYSDHCTSDGAGLLSVMLTAASHLACHCGV